MATSQLSLTPDEIDRAKAIWAEYQREHDLSDRKGNVAGIDPATGRVWVGAWFDEVAQQRDAAGISNPLFLVRVGSPTALRKGRRQ